MGVGVGVVAVAVAGAVACGRGAAGGVVAAGGEGHTVTAELLNPRTDQAPNQTPGTPLAARTILDQYGNVLRTFGPRTSGPPVLTRLVSIWKAGLDNSTLVIVGDSVSAYSLDPASGSCGYVALVGSAIAAAYPNMNVNGYIWNSGTESYPGSPTRVYATGRSGPTLNIYVFAVSGKAYDYFINQTRLDTGMTALAPDAVMIALAKNEGSLTSEQSRCRFSAMLAQFQQRNPLAELAILNYNPNSTGSTIPTRMEEYRPSQIQTARLFGADFIDAMQAFDNTGNPAAYIQVTGVGDGLGVHPTLGAGNTGMQLLADVVMEALRYEPGSAPRASTTPPLTARSPSALVNSDFQEWGGQGPPGMNIPVGWTLSNAAITQDLTNVDEEGPGGLNMQATAGGASVYAYQDAPAWFLAAAQGGTVTFTALVYLPAGQGTSNGVIAVDDGTTTSTWTWRSADAANGNWAFVSVTLKVSATATRIRAYIYGDNSATGSCNVTWGKTWLGVGAIPRRPLMPEHVAGRRFVTLGGRSIKRLGVTIANYAMNPNNDYLAFRGAAVRGATLPDYTTVPPGTIYLFKDEDGNAAVGQERYIYAFSGQFIDGASQKVITTPYGSLAVISGVAGWHVWSSGIATAADVGLGNVTNDAQLKASQLDTDGALAANSDTRVASQKATKTYADTKIPKSLGTAAGDLIAFSAAGTPVNLAIGTQAGRAVVADPSAANKVSVNNPLSLNDAWVGTTSALLASYDRRWVASILNAGAATSGTLRLFLIPLPSGLTIGTLTFWAGTTAGASLTHSWAAIFDVNRNKLAVSNDNTSAAWTASTSRAFTFGTPYLVPSSGQYYVGILIAGTTIPTIEAASVQTTGVRAAAPLPGGNTTDTGLTTPAGCPSTAGAITVLGQYPYFEVS